MENEAESSGSHCAKRLHAATALLDRQTLAAKRTGQKPLHGACTFDGVVELADLLEREAPQLLRVSLPAKQPLDFGEREAAFARESNHLQPEENILLILTPATRAGGRREEPERS